MSKNILITGARGTFARHLEEVLKNEYSIRFLTRKVTKHNEFLWNLETNYIDPEAFKNVHIIIHLAGSSITKKRWTSKRKRDILSSRVDGARLILKELRKNEIRIETFISASAIGYYGTITSNSIFNEESQNGNDFLSSVCAKWEDAAHMFKSSDVASRVVIVRLGVILTRNAGALKQMSRFIKYGFGSSLGSGNQYIPWIHIHDLSSLFRFIIINDQVNGIFNATAPQHSTNHELTKTIGKSLNRPIILPNIPKFIVHLLFGERGTVLLHGSRVSSEKIINAGFQFKYPDLDTAMHDISLESNLPIE